jgi:hypothetical protein
VCIICSFLFLKHNTVGGVQWFGGERTELIDILFRREYSTRRVGVVRMGTVGVQNGNP